MSTDTRVIVQASAQRLFPNLDLDQMLAELLLERARKNLIKYRTMARQFEARYGQDNDSDETFWTYLCTEHSAFLLSDGPPPKPS